MSWSNPIAFLGFIAIILPILIHLLSNQKRKVIFLGTTRFIKTKDSPSARSLNLTEIPLLLVRAGIIVALVLSAAELLIPKTKSMNRLIMVESEIAQDSNYDNIIKPLERKDIKIFTIGKELGNQSSFNNYEEFIDHVNGKDDTVEVFTFNFRKHFAGPAHDIKSHVIWNSIPQKVPTTRQDTLIAIDSIYYTTTKSGPTYLTSSYSSEPNPGNNNAQLDISYEIVHSSNAAKDVPQLLNLLDAISTSIPIDLHRSKNNADWVFGIDTSIYNHKAQYYVQWFPTSSSILINKYLSNVIHIRGTLSNKNLIKSNLPIVLAQEMITFKYPMTAHDKRVRNQPGELKESFKNTEVVQASTTTKSTGGMFIVLALILILVERIFASIKANKA